MLWNSNIVSDGAITVYEYRDPRLGGDSNHYSQHFRLSFHQLTNGSITNIQLSGNLLVDGSLDCVSGMGSGDNHVNKFYLSMGSAGVLIDPSGNGETMGGLNTIAVGGFTPSAAELASGQFSIVASYRTVGERPDGTQYPGNGSCNCDINVTHSFTPPDTIPPTISITEPSGTNPSDSSGSPVTSFKEVTDASASITITISDSGSGPKQFLYRINEYEFDGSSLIGPTSGSWETESGTSKTIPLTEEAIYEIEVKEAEDQKGNKSSGTEKSGKYIIINEEVAGDDAPTTVVVTPGCKDYWATGFPQDGIVTLDDLKTSPKVIKKIKDVYGMTDAEIEELWTWHTDMFALPPSDPMHSSITAKEQSTGSSSNAFASEVGALTGRSGGWFNGLYGRGHNGSSSYTATWLGRRSSGAPQPVLEHLSIYGEFWGYSTYGGWNTGIGGIRGRGTDRGGNVNVNMHRKRDAFIMEAVAAWGPGSTFPTSTHASAAAYSGQPCGIDLFLAGLDIVPQGGGTFKIDDCIAPTVESLHTISKTVLAGGKEYYIDYPNTNHMCHFEVEAVDYEYGLKEAIFTPYIDDVAQADETFPFTSSQSTETAGPLIIDTQGAQEVWCDVKVIDLADPTGNEMTESMSSNRISIDDGEPQGGTVAGNGQTSGSPSSTKTPGLMLVNPGWMVGSNPYYNSKSVEIMVEYEDEYSGIDVAELWINGANDSSVSLPSTETAEIHNSTYTVTNLNEGINNAQLYLKDLATNEWRSSVLNFYVDMTKPDAYIEFTSPQYELRENNGQVWTRENNLNVDLFYGDAGADPSGVLKGATKVGAVPTNPQMTLTGSSKTGHNQGSLEIGENKVYFALTDNVEWPEAVTDHIVVHVDQTPPEGTIVRNSGQFVNVHNGVEYTNSGANFSIDLTHSDAHSKLF